MLARLTIFVAAFYFSFAPLAWACSPLVVYIGGLSEWADKIMVPLFKRERNFYQSSKWSEQGGPDVKMRYFEWGDFISGSNDEDIAETIVKHTKSARHAGVGAPIVVVGYSYGGDTAYHALEGLSSLDSGITPLLVTLDAVGERGWHLCDDIFNDITIDIFGIFSVCDFVDMYIRDSNLEKPTAGRWLNVWTRNGANEAYILTPRTSLPSVIARIGALGFCDGIADIGGIFGWQRRAENIKYSGDHCEVEDMFDLVKEKIDQHILSSCR